MSGPGTPPGWGARRRIGLAAGPLVFALLLALGPPADLSDAAWRTAAVGALMAIWWVTEALPIAATALLPLALFPPLGAASIENAARPYANPLIFLFLGGFLLALAIERWNLHRRLALHVIGRIGTRPPRLLAGFMASAALISMWVSNTATTLMLLPIGISVVEWLGPGDADRDRFAAGLMLGIAYGATIGGLGTLIGTPPNVLLAGFLAQTYGIELGFARWMMIGVPIVVLSLPLAGFVLWRLHRWSGNSGPEGRARVAAALAELGPMSRAEKSVAFVFALTASAWVTRPLLERWVPGLSDPGIAITGALLLFLIPAGKDRGESLLEWEATRALPWGVLLLFGGGLSLAAAIDATGLATGLGTALGGLAGWPLLAILLAVAAVTLLFTELASNTATAAAFLPIAGALALELGVAPERLAIPVGLAASCAFMLPVATAPNAIVYASGAVTMGQMARTGVVLNLLFLVIVTAAAYLLVPLVFGAR